MTAGGVPHILIVDDDPEVLDVLREMVASLGYNVSTASNGAEALAGVLALQPDALMTGRSQRQHHADVPHRGARTP